MHSGPYSRRPSRADAGRAGTVTESAATEVGLGEGDRLRHARGYKTVGIEVN